MYYYVGYATNSNGTGYSTVGTFTTTAVTVGTVSVTTPYTVNPSANVSFAYTTPTTNIGSVACRLLDNTSTALTAYAATNPIVYAAASVAGVYGYYIQCQNTTYTSVTSTSSLITVNVNDNPVPDAGIDQTITLPDSLTLIGTVSDNYATPDTVVWTKVSGPNTPTITSTTNLSTTVTGLVQGTYVFRLTATDTLGLKGTDDITVTVNEILAIPTVDTPTVSSITTTTATLGATVTSLGNPAVISKRGICYNTTGSPTLADTCVTALGLTTGSYTKGVVGLTPGIRYFYAGYATNTTGTGYSADGTFVTVPPAPSGLWAGPSTCGTTYLNTSWNATDGATSYQLYREGILLYDGPLLAFQDLGLALSSTHPYQVFASNDSGISSPSITVFGTVSDSCVCPEPTAQDVSFSCPPVSGIAAVSGDVTRRLNKIYPECAFPTPATVENTQWVSDNNCKYPILPVVTTPTDTSVKATSATLGATVESLGEPASITARGVCYGISHNPSLINGAICPAEGGLNTGVFTINILNILNSTTTYYYRGYATNPNAGTGYSDEGTFTTIALPPKPTVSIKAYDIKNEPIININFGDAVVLKWTSTNAESCSMTSVQDKTGNFINLNPSGSKKLYPKNTSVYKIKCDGEGGTATDEADITVGKIKPVFKER